eukprot:gene9524-12830_t
MFNQNESISIFGIYNFPEVSSSNDYIWNHVYNSLQLVGEINSSVQNKYYNAMIPIGELNKLCLGQICSWPMLYNPKAFQLVAIPKYAFEENDNTYFSVIINRINSETNPKLWSSVAINSRSSVSGCLLFAAYVGIEVMDIINIIYTESHEQSINAVKNGQADVACIDYVTYSILKKHRPWFLDSIEINGRTTTAPAIPFVTSYNATSDTIEKLQFSLSELFKSEDPILKRHLEAVGLIGFDTQNATFPYYESEIIRLQKMASYSSDEIISRPHQSVRDLLTSKISLTNYLLSLKKADEDYALQLFDAMINFYNTPEMVSAAQIISTSILEENGLNTAWTSNGIEIVRMIFPNGIQNTQITLHHILSSKNHPPIQIVQFIGDRIPIQNCQSFDHRIVAQCWAADAAIVKELKGNIILAYITGSFGNLVIFQLSHTADEFTSNSDHSKATTDISPHYYEKVRIHRGLYDFETKTISINQSLSVCYFDFCDEFDDVASRIYPSFDDSLEAQSAPIRASVRERIVWN